MFTPSYEPEVKLLGPIEYLPAHAHDNDAGYDLKAYITEYPNEDALPSVLATGLDVFIDGQLADTKLLRSLNNVPHVIFSPINCIYSEDTTEWADDLDEWEPTVICQPQPPIEGVKNVHLINSGIAVKLPVLPAPFRAYATVVSRSGLAVKHRLVIANAPGIIDEGYSGPIFAALANLSPNFHIITAGTRVAQILFHRCIDLKDLTPYLVEEFSQEHVRGSGGYGSTGLK